MFSTDSEKLLYLFTNILRMYYMYSPCKEN